MESVQLGDLVKHKTIAWMNDEKPFRVISVENGKATCEYTGRNGIQYFHDFRYRTIEDHTNSLRT